MTLKAQFDEIVDLIRNDSCKQAFANMQELDSWELTKLLDYMADDLHDHDLALTAAKVYIRKIAR